MTILALTTTLTLVLLAAIAAEDLAPLHTQAGARG